LTTYKQEYIHKKASYMEIRFKPQRAPTFSQNLLNFGLLMIEIYWLLFSLHPLSGCTGAIEIHDDI